MEDIYEYSVWKMGTEPKNGLKLKTEFRNIIYSSTFVNKFHENDQSVCLTTESSTDYKCIISLKREVNSASDVEAADSFDALVVFTQKNYIKTLLDFSCQVT